MFRESHKCSILSNVFEASKNSWIIELLKVVILNSFNGQEAAKCHGEATSCIQIESQNWFLTGSQLACNWSVCLIVLSQVALHSSYDNVKDLHFLSTGTRTGIDCRSWTEWHVTVLLATSFVAGWLRQRKFKVLLKLHVQLEGSFKTPDIIAPHR